SPYGGPVIWGIGVLTAGLTSFYMFRLWFMTFFGELKLGSVDLGEEAHAAHAPAQAAHGAASHSHGHADDESHGHGGVHESPWVMLGPLVILAVLSFVGGWVGIPGSLGGSNHFDKFLGPVFRSSTPAVNAEHAQAGEAVPSEQTTEGEEPKTGHSTEIMFTIISVVA